MIGLNLYSLLRRRLLVFGLLALILGAAWTVPLPQNISGPCCLEPAAIWYLIVDGAGQLSTGWEKNLIGEGGERVLLNFERPDFVDISLPAGLHDGDMVEKGDTIAVVSSRENIGRLSILQAELEKAIAEHAALMSGARVEDLEVAQQEVNRAEAELETQRMELELVKSLYDSEFHSLALLQQTEGLYRVLQAELDLARAGLKALQAGAKPEEIEVAVAEIKRLQRSVESVIRMLGKRETILTPISGRVRLGGVEGYMAKVEFIDSLAVVAIIPEAVRLMLNEGQLMEVNLSADKNRPRSIRLLRTDFIMIDVPITYAIGFLPNHDRTAQIGMTGRARISIGTRTLIEGLIAKFKPAGL